MTSREGRIEVPGGNVWYQIVGDGPGIPLLALHGGPGIPHDYLLSLNDLATERPVIYYDQLGCGKSDTPADSSLWTTGRFVEELGIVIRELGFKQAHILGQSWGSMLATEYALSGGQGIVSLTLASPPLSIPRWLADCSAYRAELPAHTRQVLDQHEAANTTESAEYEAATMVFYQRHLCRMDPWPMEINMAMSMMGAEVYHTMWGPTEFNMTGGNLASYDRTPDLHELANVPVLITCGRYDEATPGACAWYQSLIPGAELEVFEKSSHTPHLEERSAYMQRLRTFLRRAEAAN